VSDNTGETRSGQMIVANGPAAYVSTLPLDVMSSTLAARDVPVVISNHAGAYLCNHVFYVVRYYLEQAGFNIPCGFIHVPDISETGVSLATMIDAIDGCLDILGQSSYQQIGLR
jgi:pyroglutamyl-peptidase